MTYNLLVLFLTVSCTLLAADLPIGVISHIGFRVADLEKTRAYYIGTLRIPQAYEQKDASGKTTLAVFQISKDQFIEMSPGTPAGFTHLAFLTEKIEALHHLIETLGLNPPEIRTGHDRTRNFSIKDPDNHRIEFVQYEPDSMQAQSREHSSIVAGIRHIGLPVADRAAATAFFKGKLGFIERGPGVLCPALAQNYSWIELLPAAAQVSLGLAVGDESPPRSGRDPDGIRIEIRSMQ